jgi:ComF family protein
VLLLRIEQGCQLCGLPLPQGEFLQCGHCIKHPPAYDQVFSPFYFQEPLRSLLHEFKYQKGLYLRTFLAELMLIAYPGKSYRPNCLIPVPMHPKRLRQRGFNQAAELAKGLSKRIQTPIDFTLCHKLKNTNSQAGLEAKERRNNLKDTFTVKPNSYQHVTLVDDLLTTGSTANELALTLKRQGVSRVDVWCLARTPVQG